MGDPARDAARIGSEGFGLSLTIVVSAAFFGYLGHWIGGKVGAQDALTLIGAFVGAVAGFYHLYVQLVVRPRVEAEREEETE